MDGDEADVTDTNDTGDSDRDAELNVSVATGDALRGAVALLGAPSGAPPCRADTCDEQMLATVVTKSGDAVVVATDVVRPLQPSSGVLEPPNTAAAAAALCAASATTEDA